MPTHTLNSLHKKTEVWRGQVTCWSSRSHNLNIGSTTGNQNSVQFLCVVFPSGMKKLSLTTDPKWEELSKNHGNCYPISWVAGCSLFNPWEKGWSMKLSAGPWSHLLSGISLVYQSYLISLQSNLLLKAFSNCATTLLQNKSKSKYFLINLLVPLTVSKRIVSIIFPGSSLFIPPFISWVGAATRLPITAWGILYACCDCSALHVCLLANLSLYSMHPVFAHSNTLDLHLPPSLHFHRI